MNVNPILKEILSGNITKTNRLIKAQIIFVGRKVSPKPIKEEEMQWNNSDGKEEYNNQYKNHRNISKTQSERNVEKLKRKRNTKNITQIQSQEKKKIKCSYRGAKTKTTGKVHQN